MGCSARRRLGGKQPQPHAARTAGGDHQPVVCGRFRAEPTRVHGRAVAPHNVVVKGVLHVAAGVCHTEQPLGVRFVVREQPLECRAVVGRFRRQAKFLQRRVPADQRSLGRNVDARRDFAPFVRASPHPRIAVPKRRQEVQHGRLGAAVDDRDADQDVVGRLLGVFGHNVEIPVAGEDAGIGQLELRITPAAAAVLLDEPRIRELLVRVLVQPLHVRVRRRRIDVVIALLHILAVVSFWSRQPKQPLLEERVALVP